MVSRWPRHGRVCRGGCSRVEHRLVGAVAFVPAHQYRPASLFLGGAGRGPWVVWGWWLPGTLLGPEGSGRFGSVAFLVGPGPGFIPRPVGGCGWPVGIGCRLYVENYTVDASIFVAKFLRAHGGCLGTRNR
jgi:hypothetical protein